MKPFLCTAVAQTLTLDTRASGVDVWLSSSQCALWLFLLSAYSLKST